MLILLLIRRALSFITFSSFLIFNSKRNCGPKTLNATGQEYPWIGTDLKKAPSIVSLELIAYSCFLIFLNS